MTVVSATKVPSLQATHTSHTRLLIALVLSCSAAAIGLASLWERLHQSWSDIYGPYSHGYLVLAMVGVLCVRYWREQPVRTLEPSWIALIPLAGLVLALAAMELMFVGASQLTFVPLLALATAQLVFGRACARRLFWPTLFLYFALPQWWVLNDPLQTLTAKAVGAWTGLTGFPAYLEGNTVHVPAGMFQIASLCSGLNYLMVSLALAGYFALMYLRAWGNRLKLLGVAAVLAVVFNWIRVSILVVVGVVTDMQHYLIQVDHLYFGWVLFIGVMLPLLWYARRLEVAETTDRTSFTPGTRDERAPSPTGGLHVRASVIGASAAAAIVLILPSFLRMQEPVDANFDIEPMTLVHGRSVTEGTWQPVFVGAIEERLEYSALDAPIQIYRAIYPHQTADARLIRSTNDFLGPNWRTIGSQSRSIPLRDGAVKLREYDGYLGERRHLLWSWYWIEGKSTSSRLGAKLLELRALVSGRRDAVALAVTTACEPTCDAARTRLSRFVQDSEPRLRWVPRE